MRNILRLHITLEHYTEQTLISQLPLLSTDYWVRSSKYWVMQWHYVHQLTTEQLHFLLLLCTALLGFVGRSLNENWECGASSQLQNKQIYIYLSNLSSLIALRKRGSLMMDCGPHHVCRGKLGVICLCKDLPNIGLEETNEWIKK